MAYNEPIKEIGEGTLVSDGITFRQYEIMTPRRSWI